MSKFTDQLWRDLVREHGATLALAGPAGPGRARWPRPRVVAGSAVALAGAGAALAVALSAAASTPAFAVTRQHDGSVSVQINSRSGIAGANRELAAMGIRERVMAVSDNQPVPLNCLAPGEAPDGRSLVIAGSPKIPTTPLAALPGSAGPRSTGPGSAGANTAPAGSAWHVVACSAPGASRP
jgi:hypothetical protein